MYYFLLMALGVVGFAKRDAIASTLGEIMGPFETYGPIQSAIVDNQAFQIFKDAVLSHEGRKNTVYVDTTGHPTVGIGHKVTLFDNLKVGQKISEKMIDDLFLSDTKTAFAAARQQALELKKYTPSFVAALAEVNYQLGSGWKYNFAGVYNALKNDNAQAAIDRLLQTKWYSQTPVRVSAFIQAINSNFG